MPKVNNFKRGNLNVKIMGMHKLNMVQFLPSTQVYRTLIQFYRPLS